MTESETNSYKQAFVKPDIDLKHYIEELNKGEPSFIYQRLKELSIKLCSEELNKRFPRASEDGQVYQVPVENLIWASILITTAWLGWIFKSKAIWHYGNQHPEEEIIFRDCIIPSVNDAFEQGVKKAKDDKVKEGILQRDGR